MVLYLCFDIQCTFTFFFFFLYMIKYKVIALPNLAQLSNADALDHGLKYRSMAPIPNHGKQ